jgi:hypothetical protein
MLLPFVEFLQVPLNKKTKKRGTLYILTPRNL